MIVGPMSPYAPPVRIYPEHGYWDATDSRIASEETADRAVARAMNQAALDRLMAAIEGSAA